MIVANCFKIIFSNYSTYNNDFPMRERAMLPQRQIKYVEDMIVIIDTAKIGMARKEVIQVI